MRRISRALKVSFLGFVLAGMTLTAAAWAVEPRGPEASTGNSPLSGALVIPSVDQLVGGDGARASRNARLSNPSAVAERAASRSRFEGLTRAGAARAARAAFPDLIARPDGGLPPLPAGQRIVRYASDNSAEVSLPGGKGVMESLVPIAKRTSGGRHIPLDLSLRETGGSFEPAVANVGVEVPKDLSNGISLTGAGVSLTPVDGNGKPLAATEGALAGAAVLWRDSEGGSAGVHDLTTVAKASPAGFDLTTMLFSRRSPGQLHFRVGMPAGARLKGAVDGSVRVVRSGATLAIISPVSAQDAEGSDVPVSMRVRRHTIDVNVDATGDYLYPIAVDPEVNDGQLAKTTAGKRSNWEFHTSNGSRFEGKAEYEGVGKEHLESKGIAEYAPSEYAYWGYQTKGVSHIYELKTETSAKNKLAKIESFLEFLEPGGARETKKMLSNEFENPEYTNKATTICAANASKVEECLPGSGKANNAVHFQQSATGSPGSNYKFSDTMSQGIASISEPTGTHSTTSYNTTSSELEFEVEVEGTKQKVKRKNALFGTGSWVSNIGGALELKSADTGIGVATTKLEYENSPGHWQQLSEHQYLEKENACQGVQCYPSHSEFWTLDPNLPDGEEKIRYKAEEAMSGTSSLESEGQATLKVDAKPPHGIHLEGLPFGNELSERPYELTAEATDGEGSTVASSGIKSIALFVDGSEFGTPSGSCSVAKGECKGVAKWTINGAELGAGNHAIVIVAIDNAGNEARRLETLSIRHSTPVALGPGSVDLESGDFALGASDVSLGSGLIVGRNYSSRGVLPGNNGPLGPQWNLSLGSTESLRELVDGAVLLTAGNGSQAIFAPLSGGKFESPPGDSNLELTVEENAEKQKLAYYLKDNAKHTSVKFTEPAGSKTWVPTKQEGTTATDAVAYTYQATEQYVEYAFPSASRAQQVVTGPDGKLWVTLKESSKIATLTTTGKITEYSSGITEPRDLAAGPDGNVWFTGGSLTSERRYITKMTPTGAMTKYMAPDSAYNIGLGPDGNMWFTALTEGGVHKLGKITPSGTITEYALPSESWGGQMAAGPDGNVWLADQHRSKIVRMTTGGTITGEYATTSAPGGITAGPDGKLWFTEGTKVAKITTAGTITEYTVPGESSTGGQIVSGPDGNVWFETCCTTSKVGRITTSGTITLYAVAEGNAKGLAVGPDGNIWFTKEYPTSIIGNVPITGLNVRPTEVLAPKPAGVSCEPELKAGCRALKFQYATATTATGEAPEQWGEFKTRLKKAIADVYNPSTKAMQETTVAEYTYDKYGRLRAEWDPRISPNLKTIYGYDAEGHMTAMNPPGQEPWAFSYGTIAGDTGTGRLLKAMRSPASAGVWNGTPVTYESSALPRISGTLAEGVKLAVTNGFFGGSPTSYSYQWKDCNSSGLACKAILGATNPNYTLKASDVGYTIVAAITGTNGGGSATIQSTATGVVQAISSGQFTEYGQPYGSIPTSIAAGPDGKLWFTDKGTKKVGKITTSGTTTEYTPSGVEPRGITAGPDGNMWLGDLSGSHHVDRMTTSGTLTSYAIPRSSEFITVGPDSNLWFTEPGGYIGKMNTSGTVLAEYAVPSAIRPSGITSGPDGNVWFTEESAQKVAKVTTGGTITQYTLSGSPYPQGIAAGPDGNLWFTESQADKIAKITTSGTVTTYALPTGSRPARIVAGPDGNLWFTDNGTGKVGKISTAGVITELGMDGNSKPSGITAGPEGNIWLTTEGTNDIVKIALASGENNTGEFIAPQPGTTMEYGVALEGSEAPYQMGVNATTHKPEPEKWGQSDDPVEATAIVAADEPQGWPASSYKRATVYYLDELGRMVNVASPSTATYGSIATTEYNEFNDPIRLLSADNRATALAAGASSAEVSKLLDVQNTYNGEGKKESEVSEAGTRLIDTLGPQHMIKYVAGKEQKESLGRDHKELFYNQGAPETGETYNLLTETADLAQLANREEVEVRTTKTSYSGQSNLGWKLRAPTSVTVDPEGLKQTSTTIYDETTGEIKETRGAAAEHTLGFSKVFGTEVFKVTNPWGIVNDAEGNVWMVDSGHHRIDKFSSSTGALQKIITTTALEPEGLAIDSSGNLWVADTGNSHVLEYSTAGTLLKTVGSLGSEPGQLKAPGAVAFDSSGNLWVADTGNNRIEKFSKEGAYVSGFGTGGSELGQLSEPKGIAIDSGGNVWVADTGNNRVQEFTTGGTRLGGFGSLGEGAGQMHAPEGIRFDAAGNLWVADTLNNRVSEFSSSGNPMKQLGSSGIEPGQMKEPRAVAIDTPGNAWVSDGANNRGQEWSPGVNNAHDLKTIYYSATANTEGFTSCGEHPEWAGLVCETLPAKQPEMSGSPVLPVTTYTYNMWNEPLTTSETFGATTRTKTFTYDAAGRRQTSETTASTGTALPKVTFEYNSSTGILEKQKTSEQTITSEYNTLGQLVKYADADGNTAKYKYASAENDFLLEEVSDSSNGGASKQTYSYDSTTKLRTKLVDSAAGTFTASYDAEGMLTSVAYPNNTCALYTRNSTREATSVKYLKTTNCSETEAPVWYSDSGLSSVRGEMLSQTSTLAKDTYAYDATGQLTEAQETPTGEGCVVRLYAYDEDANRTSQTSRTPGGEGKCQTEGGTVQGHVYDEANHLMDSGVAYDGLGNVTKLPAADAEGHELTSAFYVDNAVASQTQNGVTNNYYLDPEGRVRETVTGAKKVISHYDGSGETAAWTSESAELWTRNIAGIDGTLAAVQTNGGTPVLQLHDLQGNVVATLADKAGETSLLSTYNSTEFGVPNAGKTPPKFAWLGAIGVESALASGVITYGSTSYVPQTGRLLQSEQVEAPGLPPGGTGAGAAYTAQEEPWNMQGAARAGAEAPGLEAARERAAMEAAMGAVIDPISITYKNLAKSEEAARNFWEVESVAVALVMFDVPGDLAEILGKVAGDLVSELSEALGWLHDAAEKLDKCANNHRKLHICRFEYDYNELTLPIIGTLTWPAFGKEPKVYECEDYGPSPTGSGRIDFCFYQVSIFDRETG